jgi:serine/threonine protein kinase
LAPGAVVGEYRIQSLLGRGGMGVVYAAVQPVIEKRVAIKVLSAQFSGAPDLVRRFIDEARAVNRIGHENIIDIFSFGQLPDGRHYFVMEYLEGSTLAERLEWKDLPAAEIPEILIQICDALDAAHAKKIVHRDLKPENIWIGVSTRGAPRVRLLDFGIAKLLDSGEGVVTAVGAVIGTPLFMSPEQCNGRGVDHLTDIYAMGVLMYRIFAGRLPFLGDTYAEILAQQINKMPASPSSLEPVPPPLDRLIMRCLAKDPKERPQTAGELAAALGTIFGAVTFVPRSSADGSPSQRSAPTGGPAPGSGRAGALPTLPATATVLPGPPETPAPRARAVALGVVALAALAGVIAWVASWAPAPGPAVAAPAPAPPATVAPVAVHPPAPPVAPAPAPAAD